MKTIEETKKILRLCNLAQEGGPAWAEGLWHGGACELCGGCCSECTTRTAIFWFYPKLENYKKIATFDEWAAWANPDGGYREWVERYRMLASRDAK